MSVRYAERANDEERTDHLEAWREQVDMAWRESRNAYFGFLDSLLTYYCESVRIAEIDYRQR